MKLTKYGHACVVLEEHGKRLIIDPGGLTTEFGDATNVAAVVVTHVHPDHFNPENLSKILAASPEARIFTTSEVAEQSQNPRVTVVKNHDEFQAGAFALRFLGEEHQLIHKSLPRPRNTAVMVNDIFFCPGDSYTQPDKPVDVLAVPGNAPWMKIGDSMDYIAQVKPKVCFPTHNGLLSENGHQVYNFGLSKACEDNEVEFKYLRPGESIEI